MCPDGLIQFKAGKIRNSAKANQLDDTVLIEIRTDSSSNSSDDVLTPKLIDILIRGYVPFGPVLLHKLKTGFKSTS